MVGILVLGGFGLKGRWMGVCGLDWACGRKVAWLRYLGALGDPLGECGVECMTPPPSPFGTVPPLSRKGSGDPCRMATGFQRSGPKGKPA